MYNKKPIEEIFAYSDSEYSNYRIKLLKENSVFYLLDEIDDYLQKIVETDSRKMV